MSTDIPREWSRWNATSAFTTLEELGKRNQLPGFVSMISFAYEVKEGARAYSIRSADEDYLKKDVEKVRGVLRRKGLGTMPLYLTEWNHTVADRNFINDSCYQGAYPIKSLIEINDQVTMAGYFSGTD